MIQDYLSAGFPYLALVTHEPERVAEQLAEELHKEGGTKAVWWDIVRGGRSLVPNDSTQITIPANDPMALFVWLSQQQSEEGTVVFAANCHKFMESLEYLQTIRNNTSPLKSRGNCVVFIGPVVKLPVEIERLVTVINVPLPDKAALTKTIKSVAKDGEVTEPEGDVMDQILDSASGLTSFEAENALALSTVSKGRLDPQVVFDQKAKMIENSEALSVGHYEETFDTVGGLDAMKEFCTASLAAKDRRGKPKGVLLLGVPGVGKSMFAKALGNAAGLPTINFNPEALFGSLVGQSEAKVREALKAVDAMGKSIVFIDEIEKALSGSASSGRSDGGTTSRVFGTFIKWMNDRKNSEAYIVATCNDISALPPEFSRAERWDCLFFLDLPSEGERDQIWDIYEGIYEIKGDHPSCVGWTGAEISTCYRIADLLGKTLIEAGEYIVPLVETMTERITALRSWAEGRCIDGTHGGRFRKERPNYQPADQGRRISKAR